MRVIWSEKRRHRRLSQAAIQLLRDLATPGAAVEFQHGKFALVRDGGAHEQVRSGTLDVLAAESLILRDRSSRHARYILGDRARQLFNTGEGYGYGPENNDGQ
jgi:hypothetical protein